MRVWSNMDLRWKVLKHPSVLSGYMVSQFGDVRVGLEDDLIIRADYHSSNGYDFILLVNDKNRPQYFPIDEIVAVTFINVPKKLMDKPLKVNHINGDTHDISLDNLEWIEDVEEWNDIIFPNVRPHMYEVSNWGNIRRKYSNYLKAQTPSRKGYLLTWFMNENIKDKPLHIPIHRIVCYQYMPIENPSEFQVNHINGIKTDNIPKNLEWCTNSMNTEHKMMSGLHTKRPSRISTDEIDMVLDLFMKDYTPLQVYQLLDHEKYPNLTENVIRDIRRFKKTYRRSNKYDISKIHFKRIINNPPRNFSRLNVVTLDVIRDIFMEYDGSIEKTYNECLKLKIDASKAMIQGIKYGVYTRSYKYDLTKSKCYPWIRKD